MADFLSSAERAGILAEAESVFDTLTQGRTITVVKEPMKTEVSAAPSNDNVLFGFGEQQGEPVYTYTPQTKEFPGIVIYPRKREAAPLVSEPNVRIGDDDIMIKVRADCKEYIYEGRTEHILADGKTFYLNGENARQMMLSSNFFLVPVKMTK
jgi:hypothetical protein